MTNRFNHFMNILLLQFNKTTTGSGTYLFIEDKKIIFNTPI